MGCLSCIDDVTELGQSLERCCYNPLSPPSAPCTHIVLTHILSACIPPTVYRYCETLAVGNRTVHPPDAKKKLSQVTPLTYEAPLEQRKRATLAISSGSPDRP